MEKTKLSSQPYKGARDFYPEEMRVRNYIFDTWKKVCQSYGFEEYDFPIMEPLEIFAAKSGEEIVNDQLFKLTDKGERKLAIRPELTPGTVRMIANRYNELQKPLKWFMIGNNWRFEKPQLGRGREFYQLEVNVFGVEDVTADFEIFSIVIDIMKAFGAGKDQFLLLFSDRRLILALLSDFLGLSDDLQVKVRRIMDKYRKLSAEDFSGSLAKLGLSAEQITAVSLFMKTSFENLRQVIPENILVNNAGYVSVKKLFSLLSENNLLEYCRFDPSIIRGFDYSDGLVYEVFDKNPKNSRSIFGGERFDRLINIFGNFNLPATGFAMGDYTLLEFLRNWNLLPEFTANIDYLVTLWPEDDQKFLKRSIEVSRILRENSKSVFTWLEPDTKLDKQLKYADKAGVTNVVIIGENEISSGLVTVKNMKTREQRQVKVEELISII